MRTELALAVLAISAVFARPADAACIPGFDHAIFARNTVHLQGNAGTDSYDSAVGPYASTNTCDGADVGSNATGGGDVHIQSNSTTVCGDVYVGAGGTPAIVVTGNGNITGTRTAQPTNLPLPIATFPALPAAAVANHSFSNTPAALPPNFAYGNVTCSNGSLTLGAGKYIFNTLVLRAGCNVLVGGAPIEIYFQDTVSMTSGTVVNVSNVPSNVIFYGGAAATTVHAQGGVDASFAVYAPTADCELRGNADVWGALVCDDVRVQGNAHVHYDRALANFGGASFACPVKEVSRATPIIADIANQTTVVQGTFELPTVAKTTITSVASVASFAFPFIKGHMRARIASSINTTGSAFGSSIVLFDAAAAGKIPPAINSGCGSFTGACRNVFTTTQTPDPATGVSFHPPRVQLNDGNADAIGSLIAPVSAVSGIGSPEWQTIVRKVIAGALGGVDRSTVAVIGPSAVAGLGTRPAIVYFGAADGMLHAVCASVNGTTETAASVCPSLGTELWAFMPRVQLPLVRTNNARIDGSVRVIDAFGDFVNNPATGQQQFRTVLTFQTGSSDAAIGAVPAVYSLDVTDPANPIVLWEYTAPTTSPSTTELGTGLTIASGPVLVANKPTNLVFAQTNNGGSGAAGVVAVALSLETGARLWKFGYEYPTPPRGDTTALPLPLLGIPGGAVAVDLLRQGFLTDVVMGDLYGNLWRLDATSGASRTGATPLFSFSANKKPIGAMPAIYSDGNQQFAVFGSGGYADPLLATWAAGTQHLVSVSLVANGPYPLDETSANLAFVEALTAGARAFAQVLIIGTQVFLSTDSADVNLATYGSTTGTSGQVLAYDLVTSNATFVTVRGGASSLAAAGSTLYASSSDQQQQLGTAANGSVGASVDSAVIPQLVRRLWLRTQ